MSLYYVQKLLYQLNRDPHARARFDENFEGLLDDFDLTEEEKAALRAPDIGLLYVMGVNGQILMHYAALRGFEWDRYIQAMRDGLKLHGPVRAGLYLTTDGRGAV
ncbi:MAG: aromatic ring-opening dioxygenase subunit LigA [Gammaproteobacteria bacterium]|nr:aromatic ring-opening dioxygenase subunit LigA [Gammaproteobacteria bacterium]MCY4344753.1 aromatic ring-opening dioxygenase subunit LigA [Gammaproteobacteria bacterium]